VGLLLMLLFHQSVTGQYILAGQVLDSERMQPLSGAHVVVVNTYLAAVTDASGSFRFSGLSPGWYPLRVSYMGYGSRTDSVLLRKDTNFRFSLQPLPLMADEVVVQATRVREGRPAVLTNLAREEIRERNLGQDIPYILSLTPSLVTTSDAGAGMGYTGLRIRGTDITRINVTVNGIPLNDPESQGVFWVNMPDLGSSLESVQVQRGAGTSTYGAAAFGASINLRTHRLAEKPYMEINQSIGSFNTFKHNVLMGTGLLGDRFTFDARLSRLRSDGYIDRASSNLASHSISAGYYGKKTIIRATLFSGRERTYQAWDGIPSVILDTNRTWNGIGRYTDLLGEVHYYDNETDNYRQDHYHLTYAQQLRTNLTLNLAAFYVHGEGYYEQYKEDQAFVDYGLGDLVLGTDTITHTDLIRQKWLDNDFYGLNGSLSYVGGRSELIFGGGWNTYAGDHFGEVIWSRLMPQAEASHRWYLNEGIKTEASAFFKGAYQLTTRFSLTGDVQLRTIDYTIQGQHDDLRDLGQDRHYLFVNPRAGVYWKWSDRQSLFISLAMTNREPTRSDLRDADAGRVPGPERLVDHEFGYQLRHERLSLDAILFFMDYYDQLVLTGKINNVGAPVFTNVPRSYRAGIELAAMVRLTSRLEWKANLSLSRNRILNFTEYVDDWDTWTQVRRELGETDIAFSPWAVAGSQLSYTPAPGWTLQLGSKYVGKQYIDNTSSEARRLDPYHVHQLRAAYRFSYGILQNITMNLLIDNLLNEEYETNAWVYRYFYSEAGERKEGIMDGYFPQAGRHFLLGLSVAL